VPTVGFHDGTGSVYGGQTSVPQGVGGSVSFRLLAASDATTTIVVSLEVESSGNSAQAVQIADAVIETIRFPSDEGAA
jgi:hypothetical protein